MGFRDLILKPYDQALANAQAEAIAREVARVLPGAIAAALAEHDRTKASQ